MTADRVKFDAMPVGHRARWIDWANSHDWGGGSRCAYYDAEAGELVTFCGVHDGTRWTVEEARHKTPKELRDWAGY